MFERFTDRARRVLVLAQEEARKLGHAYIGTEHLVLALIEEGQGVAAKTLDELGFKPDQLRARILEVVGPGDGGSLPASPPFTPRSKKVLELSLREALALGHNYIGTEHLLLGLIREGEGIGAQVLVAAGVKLEDVRAKVIELLKGFVGTPPRASGTGGVVTPAASAVQDRARAEAGAEPLGTQHYLLAILTEENSLGARLLQSLGVTKEAVRERIDSMGVVGTSDELPPPPAPTGMTSSPVPRFELVLDNGMTLRVHDEVMAEQFRAAVVAGVTTDPPGDLANAVREALVEILKPKDEEPPA